MNSNKLISIDDADLETVAGGISASLDLGRLAKTQVSLDEGGAKWSLSLFGKKFEFGASINNGLGVGIKFF